MMGPKFVLAGFVGKLYYTGLPGQYDTLGGWHKCHINRLSYYLIFTQYIKVHLGIPKKVILQASTLTVTPVTLTFCLQ